MPESPIVTVGEVVEIISERLSTVKLKNGKRVTGFPSKRAASDGLRLNIGDFVSLEMTPFDFSKARITEKTANPDT